MSGDRLVQQALDLAVERRLVVLERQDVVAAAGHDLPGDLALAAHRVRRHRRACQVEQRQQVRDGRDLVGLVGHRALGEDHTVVAVVGDDERADQVGHAALVPGMFERAPDRLAVDRDQPRAAAAAAAA